MIRNDGDSARKAGDGRPRAAAFERKDMDIRERLERSFLYLVTGAGSRGRTLEQTVEAALRGGADIVQLRLKGVPDVEALDAARALRRLTRDAGALFIVNDSPSLALASEADGAHLGQEDMPVAEARRILGPGAIIGVSTHAPDQARKALADGADYLGVGPVYPTPTKAGRPAVGLEYVSQATVLAAALPWFAIGGVQCSNLPEVMRAGARRVAVVRAITEAENPEKSAREIKALLRGEVPSRPPGRGEVDRPD